MKPLCIYHKNCVDGFASAWVLASHFGFDNIDFLEADYHDTPPDFQGRDVFIVDFSYKPNVLIPALKGAAMVIMIDHHKAQLLDWQQLDLPKNFSIVSDLTGTQSGASLTWQFFNRVSEMPRLLKHCQDWDTWKFKLQCTREVITGLKARGYYKPTQTNFKEFGMLVRDPHGTELLEREGRPILNANKQLIYNWIERNSTLVEFEGFMVPIANVPYEFASEAGHILSEGYPFSITYEDNLAKDRRKYSLRSQAEKGVHVDKIAQRYGGNGHENSAGFILPLDTDPAGLRFLSDKEKEAEGL